MITVYLLGGGIAAFIFGAIMVAMRISKVTSIQRKKALEERVEQSRQALVRYVMLNRQCSEDAAYQRLATFIKKHTLLDDHSFNYRMLAHDRQSLVDRVHSILAHDPDEVDKI